MKKSTGVILVLIIVLLLGVIGVGGVFFVKGNNDSSKEIAELKNEVAGLSKNVENTTSEPTKNNENTANNNVNTNTSTTQQNTSTENNKNTNTTKTYSDIKGTYESQTINMNDESDEEPYNRNYTLMLSDKGTFAYYHLDTDCHYVGYYTIVNNKITLNSVVLTGNDPSASLSNDSITITLNSDGTIVDNDKGMFGKEINGALKFTRKSETLKEDINIAKVIDKYLAGCGTSGKDGQGPWFSGLDK